MKSIISKLKRLFHYRRFRSCIYTGKGHTQGAGFDVECEKLEIAGFTFITDITVSTCPEWIRDLKRRMKADDEQQKTWEKYMEKEHGENWRDTL